MTKWTSVVVICGLLSQSVSALAQGAAPPQGSTPPPQEQTPASPPPDVVLTKAGAMVRGTISEKDPEGDVLIQTMSGDMRRFPMSEVTYAGPAEGMPKPTTKQPKPSAQGPTAPQTDAEETKQTAQPKIRVKARDAALTLKANRPDVTFHLKTGSANFDGIGTGWSGGSTHAVDVSGTTQAYSVICTAPCEAVLPTGTHRMALSLDGGGAVEDEESVTLSGPMMVNGKYTSNKGLRTAGVVVGLGAMLGGTILMFSGLPSAGDSSSGEVGTEFYLGGVLIGVGLITWLALGFRKDVAEIDAEAATAQQTQRTAKRGSTHGIRLSPAGLMF